MVKDDINIQVLCYNIHKGAGWRANKPTLTQISKRIHELNTDIVMLQEVRGVQFDYLTSQVWQHYSYGKNATNRNGHHGNAILSKYPVIHSENFDLSLTRYERRGLLYNVIEIPEYQQKIHLICVHLNLFARHRRKQFEMIVSHINKNIAGNEPIILGGDFNDWGSHATLPLVHELGLQETFLTAHKAYAKTFPAWAPVLKLDRIYFRGFAINYANRLNKNVWRHLSDHLALNVSLKLISS